MVWQWEKLLSPLRFVFVLGFLPRRRHADVEISSGFVTEIVGIPKAEAQAIIHYLNELIATTQEIHVRFQWQKNDVAFWDNRICVSYARPSIYARQLTSERTILHPMALPHIAGMQYVLQLRPSVRISIPPANLRKRR